MRLVADPLVPADRVRAHLIELSDLGVGRRAVSAACDVAPALLRALRIGRRTRLRLSTEQRILAVDAGAAADRALIPAAETHARVARLVDEHGYTRAEIARRLGRRSRYLKLGRERVTARVAHRIARLLADAEGAFLDGLGP